ncbi:hypothetical protein AYI70_g2896 [Smittium culicis]|uniref:Uncharacterized protein n=1 Tax=Smittium culicis TaxID=133412 RepID=A0A1R1Y609_9FUNG|nr:hypothetical protein AYI70_g2896 [Smittium culicis]
MCEVKSIPGDVISEANKSDRLCKLEQEITNIRRFIKGNNRKSGRLYEDHMPLMIIMSRDDHDRLLSEVYGGL